MILIAGATGSNGTELIKLLTTRGIAAHALVRNPDKAGEIALPGSEIFQGNIDDPDSLRAALDRIKPAFLLTPSSERAEAQQIGFVEAANLRRWDARSLSWTCRRRRCTLPSSMLVSNLAGGWAH